ncbi:MAG: oligosaccharide flippase family protein [Planctomycetes bacterium]|nr:oligosaccharide flippase family protein [Planctomycetota bacterium]
MSGAGAGTDLVQAGGEGAVPPHEPEGESLRTKAVRGSIWTLLGYGGGQAWRLLSHWILAKILSPGDFGLMLLVLTVIVSLEMVSDLGQYLFVQRDPRGAEPRVRDSAFTLQVVRGVVLAIATTSLAHPVAAYYGRPELVGLLIASALNQLVAAVQPMALFVAARNLEVKKLTYLDLSSQILGSLATIALALYLRSAWALVLGTVVGTVCKVGLAYVMVADRRDRLVFDPPMLRELLRFGRWTAVSSTLYLMSRQIDKFFLGPRVGDAFLGLYYAGGNLAEPIVNANSRLSGQVLFPVMAQVLNSPTGQGARMYAAARRRIDLLFMPAAGGLFALAPVVVGLFYDERYEGAAPILRFFAAQAVLRCLIEPANQVVYALGHAHMITLSNVLRAALILGGVPLAYSRWGVDGLLWALVGAEAPVLVVLWVHLARRRLLPWRAEVVALLVALATAALTLWAGRLVGLPL